MKSVTDFSPEDDRSSQQQPRAYLKPALVFALLLAMYLLVRWVPVDRDAVSAGIGLHFLIYWLIGGGLTLCFLVFSGRKH